MLSINNVTYIQNYYYINKKNSLGGGGIEFLSIEALRYGLKLYLEEIAMS